MSTAKHFGAGASDPGAAVDESSLRQHDSIFESSEPEDASYVRASSKANFALSLPSPLKRVLKASLFSILLLSPIFFGAAHAQVYLSFEALIFVVTALLLFRYWREVGYALSAQGGNLVPPARHAMVIGLFLFGYFIAQNVALSFFTMPHPILGEIGLHSPWWSFHSSLRSLGAFFALFFCASIFCAYSFSRVRSLRTVLLWSAGIVCFIGLSHWFYDNGKLFWVFEPNSVFESARARWPFVNSNHLGHFSVLAFFLFLSEIEVRMRDLTRTFLKRRSKSFADLFHYQDLQMEGLRILFLVVGLLLSSLCIAGSLSRSSWIGVSCGILLYFLGSALFLRTDENDEVHKRLTRKGPRGVSSRLYRNQGGALEPANVIGWLRKFFRPVLFVLACYVFVFFLNERGQQLVEARVDFAKTHTMDDIRWQMYSDTTKMIADNLLFGVGLGNWEPRFFRYMSEELGGINPEYLHSDPIQLIAEGGLLALVPVLLFIGFCVYRTAQSLIPTMKGRYFLTQIRTLGMLCSLVAFSVASFFDFPFHIPALSYFVAVYLAVMLAQVQFLRFSQRA